ncbi:DAN domain family member 5 [Gouania willdenowi]|uniref:DAN domain family member 5-like n=1 Tax=Gouania willdenowi TaxID=441366 RepID=A0A8C5EGC1_GOUWI|nr:DAN domain family member 5-like [Gouania willdenowi]
MSFLIVLIFLSSLVTGAAAFPHSFVRGLTFGVESSGSEPDESVRGNVRVVKLDPRTLAHSEFLRRGLTMRKAFSHNSRLPLPAFLSNGRPGPALAHKAAVSQPDNLSPKTALQMQKKKIGQQMWQRVIGKENKKPMVLPVSLKDSRQSCSAVPFTQHVTADGCETVTVHNKLCFGQCSSLFVPSEGEFVEQSPQTGAFQHRAPCSRCAPSKAHSVSVPLRCGSQVRQKKVMVVEECKCETGREEKSTEATADRHL